MKNKIHRKRDAIKPVFCRSHHYKLPLELNGKKHIFLGLLMRIQETQIHTKKTQKSETEQASQDRRHVCVCVCVTAAQVTSQAWDRLCGLGMIFIVTTPLVSFCM